MKNLLNLKFVIGCMMMFLVFLNSCTHADDYMSSIEEPIASFEESNLTKEEYLKFLRTQKLRYEGISEKIESMIEGVDTLRSTLTLKLLRTELDDLAELNLRSALIEANNKNITLLECKVLVIKKLIDIANKTVVVLEELTS